MRVIGGEFRSRILKSLPGLDVRPTPDRLRESLFNVLATRIKGTVFVDLYAGTGAVGIEALSRGAAQAIFVEHSRSAVLVIRENLKTLGIGGDRAQVRHGRATAVIPKIMTADIVFLDPPYHLESEYEKALGLLGENPPALVIAQHPPRIQLKEQYVDLRLQRILKHGDNALSFYQP